MKRVTGISGVFFKSDGPEKMYEWYEKHLGIKKDADGYVGVRWRGDPDTSEQGMTAWSIFKRSSQYFDPSQSPFMINYRVDDLDGLLEALRPEGVEIDPKREDYDYS